MNKLNLDKSVFIPSILMAGLIGLGFVAATEKMTYYTGVLDNWVKTTLGWLFLLFGLGMFLYALWLGLGKYGAIRLGDADEEPEFSTLHWIAMTFTAGIGAGLVTWAFGEPIYYIQDPPFGIQPMSTEAFEWAHFYPLIHWGFVPWAFYAVAAVPIAFSLYVQKHPHLRIGESCDSALPRTGNVMLKTLIDIFIILGIIAGTTTSLGIGVPLLSAMVAELTGVEDSFGIKISVLVLWMILFGGSTVLGLKRGIQKLADFNMVLAIFSLVIILVAGPTVFILNLTTNSLGLFTDNFFRVILWTDPFDKSGFPETWTVFYWAWWVSFAAFVGLFIARISRGRTVRQIIFGTIVWGSLGTMTYLAIAGGYALHLQKTGILPLTEILNDEGLAVMTAQIAGQLPLGKISLVFFMILCTVFYATTLDSAAYISAGISSSEFDPSIDPPLALRVIWICILFIMTLGVVLTESLDTVMAITIVGAVPVIPVIVLMCVALIKSLDEYVRCSPIFGQ